MQLDRYVAAAAEAAGVPASVITGQRRDAETVAYRHAAMICAFEDGASKQQIARALGWRDHTTVGHAIRRNNRSRVAEVREALA